MVGWPFLLNLCWPCSSFLLRKLGGFALLSLSLSYLSPITLFLSCSSSFSFSFWTFFILWTAFSKPLGLFYSFGSQDLLIIPGLSLYKPDIPESFPSCFSGFCLNKADWILGFCWETSLGLKVSSASSSSFFFSTYCLTHWNCLVSTLVVK